MQYTIEKHLGKLADTDENVKLIYSIWNLNKNNLKKALSTIQISFPHYSLHDYSHADTIIKNIELFLGRERIEQLTPTDAWLILMSAYTHDIGMVVFMKDLEAKMNAPEFITDLKGKAANRKDQDLADAAKLLLKLLCDPQKENVNIDSSEENTINYALRIKRSLTLLSAELFRKIHHHQSREIISGINESFYNEFNKFYSPDIPIRFLQILGDIAYGHGIDFNAALDLLEPKSNGYCSDYMHPRFVGCLLRLGDLLDVDDKRFNHFAINIFDKKNVATSMIHQKKHASVKHLLVTPENIEVTVDCKDDENVFRIANQWFDWLKEEVDKQNREWHSIRPAYLSGLAPTISRNKVQVLLNGKVVEPEFINLQFNISKEKVFEIFEGSALYDDPAFVFLREISQNSVDATKIQLWTDIRKGVYDTFIKTNLEQRYNINTSFWTHEDIIRNIRFPQDIPEAVYKNYTTVLNIDWKDSNKEVLKIEITDKGCGINKDTLLRMCGNVGESRKHDNTFQKLKESMPFFLKPTGAFGLGLQSIFIVTEEFIMKTKSEDDTGWMITFRSAKNSEYISVQKDDTLTTTGSTLIIEIPRLKFRSIFPNFFDYDIITNFDIYSDSIYYSPYILQIVNFISSDISSQDFLECHVLGQEVQSERSFEKSGSELDNFQLVIDDKHVLCNLFVDSRQNVVFNFFEFIDGLIGSEVTFDFSMGFMGSELHTEIYPSRFRTVIAVRGLRIGDESEDIYTLPYCSIRLNILNAESDKILNIARSRIIDKEKEKLISDFYKVTPVFLESIKTIFEKNYDSLAQTVNKEELGILYFHLQLSFLINKNAKIQQQFKKELYKNVSLPERIISSYDNEVPKPIKIRSFFQLQQIVVQQIPAHFLVQSNKEKNRHYYSLEDYKKAWKKLVKMNSNLPIVWSENYFTEYFGMNYVVCDFIYNLTYNCICGIVLKKADNNYVEVDLMEDSYNSFYNTYLLNKFKDTRYFRERRVVLYPISPYARVLAVNRLMEGGFESFPRYTNHGIISPFKNVDQLNRIVNTENLLSKDREDIISIINEKYITTLISDKMVNHIIKFASIEKHSAATIRQNYSAMIADIISTLAQKSPPL